MKSIVWSDDLEELPAGDRVAKRALAFESGILKLVYDNGTTMIAQGPADFSLLGEREVYMREGRASVHVSAGGKGFSVKTETGDIIDLGTQFFVEVKRNRKTEVHVIEGRVNTMEPGGKKWTELTTSQAVRMTRAGSETVRFDSERFIHAVPGNHYAWLFDEGQGVQTRIEQDGFASYADVAATFRSVEAQRTGPDWVSGVRGKGHALRFRKGDYMETNIKGIGGTAPRTFAFWVKIPKSDAEKFPGVSHYMSVLSYGDWEQRKALSIKLASRGRGVLRLNSAYQPLAIGRTSLWDGEWHHVAVVLSPSISPNQHIQMLAFVDGKPEPLTKLEHYGKYTGPETGKASSRTMVIGRVAEGSSYFSG
ncbi:MAG: FecR domain-containing protein, partial [Verrucomicrobiota bacterium]